MRALGFAGYVALISPTVEYVSSAIEHVLLKSAVKKQIYRRAADGGARFQLIFCVPICLIFSYSCPVDLLTIDGRGIYCTRPALTVKYVACYNIVRSVNQIITA